MTPTREAMLSGRLTPMPQIRTLESIVWPFIGPLGSLDYLLLGAIGAAAILAMIERATRASHGPAWSMLLAIPWIALLVQFCLTQLSWFGKHLSNAYEPGESVPVFFQQIGEIALTFLWIGVLFVVARDPWRKRLAHALPHLIPGLILLLLWAVLENHLWQVQHQSSGWTFIEELEAMDQPKEIFENLGVAMGALCIASSLVLVFLNRRRRRGQATEVRRVP